MRERRNFRRVLVGQMYTQVDDIFSIIGLLRGGSNLFFRNLGRVIPPPQIIKNDLKDLVRDLIASYTSSVDPSFLPNTLRRLNDMISQESDPSITDLIRLTRDALRSKELLTDQLAIYKHTYDVIGTMKDPHQTYRDFASAWILVKETIDREPMVPKETMQTWLGAVSALQAHVTSQLFLEKDDPLLLDITLTLVRDPIVRALLTKLLRHRASFPQSTPLQEEASSEIEAPPGVDDDVLNMEEILDMLKADRAALSRIAEEISKDNQQWPAEWQDKLGPLAPIYMKRFSESSGWYDTQIELFTKRKNKQQLIRDWNVNKADLPYYKRTIEELKETMGYVRTFVRVKPGMGGAGAKADDDKHGLQICGTSFKGFNYVFDETKSNEDVYNDGIKELFDRIRTNWNNLILFSFGTSGSGKTYTLFGNDSVEGVINRGLRDLQEKSCTIDLVTVFELYVNTDVANTIHLDRPQHSNLKGVLIQHKDALGNYRVLSNVVVESEKDKKSKDKPATLTETQKERLLNEENVRKILQSDQNYHAGVTSQTLRGFLNDINRQRNTNITDGRITISTRIKHTVHNPQSSRSHLFAVFRISKGEKGTDQYRSAILTVVDAAGQENPQSILDDHLNKGDKLSLNHVLQNHTGAHVQNIANKMKPETVRPFSSNPGEQEIRDKQRKHERVEELMRLLYEGIFIGESILHLRYFIQKRLGRISPVELQTRMNYNTNRFFYDPENQVDEIGMTSILNALITSNRTSITNIASFMAVKNEEKVCETTKEALRFISEISSGVS